MDMQTANMGNMQYTGAYGKFTPFLSQPRLRPDPALPEFDGGIGGHLLEQIQGVKIKQKKDLKEIVTGCDFENEYKVKPMGVKKAPKFFKVKEKSTACSRNCKLPFTSRGYNIKIENKLDKQVSFWIEKSYACPFFCLDRPSMSVYAMQDQRKVLIGTITDLMDCANFSFEIKNAKNERIYTVFSNCCQLALWC